MSFWSDLRIVRPPKRPYLVRFTNEKQMHVWARDEQDAARQVSSTRKFVDAVPVAVGLHQYMARLRDAVGPWCALYVLATVVGGEWFCLRTGVDVRWLLFGLFPGVLGALTWYEARN